MEISPNILLGGSIILLFLSVIFPILLAKNSRLIRRVSLSFALLANIFLIFFSIFSLYLGSSFTLTFSHLFPALNLEFFVDNLAAFFLLTISLIGTAVIIYSYNYIEHHSHEKKKNIHVSLMNLFILSMILVVVSRNMLAFLIFWELMSISSFLLVCFEYEKEETRKAALFYFIMTQLSTVFLMGSFLLLYNQTGSFEITKISMISPSLLSLAFIFTFIGFGIKAGIIPFHKWLPYAHPAAPSNISALMSGLMIKVSLYGFIRFLLFVFPATNLWWGILILVAGTVSAILGVIYALKEHDLKRLLAYHSIENIGIIIMGIGLNIIFTYYQLSALAAISLAAALFHTLNHGLFKSLLFLTAGSVVAATHTKNIEEMGGLIKKMPMTAILFLIGAVSISALPPFNGFVSEFLLFHSLLQAGLITTPLVQILLLLSLALLGLTSALAAACFVKAFGMVFLAVPRSPHAMQAKEVHKSMLIGPSFLALLCIILGVFSFQIFSLVGLRVGYSFPIPNLIPVVIAAIILLLLIFLALRFFSSTRTRVSETWGCGISSQNSRMEYTASGFSEPIVTIFSFIYQPKKINERQFIDNRQVVFKEGKAEIHLVHFFEEYLYLPIARLVQKISLRLYLWQNEVAVDSYILYEFLGILALIIIMGVII